MDSAIRITNHDLLPDRLPTIRREQGLPWADKAPGKYIGPVWTNTSWNCSTTAGRASRQPGEFGGSPAAPQHPHEGWIGPWEVLDLLHNQKKLRASTVGPGTRCRESPGPGPGIKRQRHILRPGIFAHAGFAEEAIARVRRLGLARDRVELELIGNAYIRDFDRAAANIAIYAQAGIRIALERFRPGYST